MKLKTGIIGCGKVGDFHAKAYAQLENSEFTAVCDADLERAKAFAERYNVHAYSDIAEMIQKEHLDVVSVCTPHPIHCDPAVTAAENGCNVLIEKPLASSLADCDRIIEAGDKNHVTIGTMVQRRFYRPCMRIHEAIEAGKIGKPVLGMVTMLGWRDKAYYDSDAWRGTWKGEGGGVLVNQAPHQLALYGKVHVFGENGAGVGVQTDGGAMFIAGMSTITEPPYNDLWTVEGEADKLEDWKKGDCDFFNSVDSMYYYHQEQIKDFLHAVETHTKPLVDARDGRKTVELFEAIYRSTQTNSVIKFPIR